MAESVFGKPIDNAVKELSDKIGIVPSGQTVEGQIDALNNKIVYQDFSVSGVHSSTNLEQLTNIIDITKSGYVPFCATIISSWDESSWVHTIKINSATTATLKSLHVGTLNTNITVGVRIGYIAI